VCRSGVSSGTHWSERRSPRAAKLTSAPLLVALGLGVGIFGTLVGAGGGFILTPVLLLLYPRSAPKLLSAISLVVVFFNAASGSAAYARQRRIDYRSGSVFALATLPGSVLGALLAGTVSRSLFDVLMGVALIAMSLWLAGEHEPAEPEENLTGSPRVIVDRAGHVYRYHAKVRQGAFYSVGVGFVSSFLGIGGGVVHVPLMARVLGFPTHLATATSHFVLVFMAAAGSLTHILTGTFSGGQGLHRALELSIGVIVGAQVGAAFSQRLSGRHIQRLLAVGLLGLGVRLVVGVLL
jgi:uncharacterized membrane protein YfcA